MPASARVGDIWVGICCCHISPPCVPMAGFIVTGSPDITSTASAQSRLSDITIGGCGHPGTLIPPTSPTVLGNSLQKATLGTGVTGCNIGTVVTGSPSHIICFGGGGFSPVAFTEFQGRTIVHTEVDFGNKDDDADSDDGLNIYPAIETVNGVPVRSPTTEELARSAALDNSPTTTVDDSTSVAQISTTPPTSCLEVTVVPPDDFQLSTNFILSDVSTKTAISKRRVKEQAGFTVQDIVCNLQGWCENIGEALSSQYGRDEILITSGFRWGSGKSQHDRGQATDIQFPNMSNSEVYDVAVWINENLPYDQLILEYGGNNPWIHSSFNRDGNRSPLASNKFGTRKSPGNYQFGSLLNMA